MNRAPEIVDWLQQNDSLKRDTATENSVNKDSLSVSSDSLLQRDSADTPAADEGFNFADSLMRNPSAVTAPVEASEDTQSLNTEPSPVTDRTSSRVNTSENTPSPAPETVETTDTSEAGKDTSLFISNIEFPAKKKEIRRLPGMQDVPVNISPQPGVEIVPWWSTGVLLLVLVLLAWIRVNYRKRIREVFNAFVNNRLINQMLRNENALTNRPALILSAVFIIMLGLLITKVTDFYQLHVLSHEGSLLFLYWTGIVLAFFVGKATLLRMTGAFFEINSMAREYIFTIFLYNKVLGIVLIPVMMLAFYLPFESESFMLKVGMGLIALFFIIRFFKSLYAGITSTNISWLYIILYLCTLEILPLAIIARLIVSSLNA